MANRERLKELLKRLDSLESSLPIGDTKNYIDSLLEKETENFKSNFKSNDTVKYLDGFNTKLERFKRDFNLEPIISAIENLQGDLSIAKDSSIKEFERISKEHKTKYDELSTLVKDTRKNSDKLNAKEISGILVKMDKLQSELSYQSKDSSKKGQTLNQAVAQLEARIEDAFKELKTQVVDRGDLTKSLEARFKEKGDLISKVAKAIEELRREMLSRISGIHIGGNANRQINVKSSVMSTKYTDINFQNGGGVSWSASDDNTFKRVNITASVVSSGGSGSGDPAGNDSQIQYNDGGVFGASSTLAWNKNTSILTVGNSGNASVLSVNGPSSILQMTGGATISGNVGIGVTEPGANLEVSKSGGGVIRVSNPGTNIVNGNEFGRLSFQSYDSSTNASGEAARIRVTALNTWASSDFQARLAFSMGAPNNITGQTDELMSILNSGNVGIGTTSPGSKLEVGLQGSVAGTIRTAGASSGYVQIQPASVAGNWILTLPSNDGLTGQYLLTDGNGITQWASVTASGGSGITRSVTETAVSSTIGGVASTDYAVFATAGVKITLPTAISNTNQYTIKNMSASSVLLATSAGETIDGSDTALLPTQYESLSLVSNNSVWGIV